MYNDDVRMSIDLCIKHVSKGDLLGIGYLLVNDPTPCIDHHSKFKDILHYLPQKNKALSQNRPPPNIAMSIILIKTKSIALIFFMVTSLQKENPKISHKKPLFCVQT